MAKESNNGPVYAGACVACVLIVVVGAIILSYSGGGWGMKGSGWKSSNATTGGSLSSISVSASGTAKGTPSMAQVSVYINATGNTTSSATANLSASIARFNSTVSSYVNGNTSLIKTGYLNVGRAYTNTSNTPVYEAQEYITVTLPNVSRVNGMLSNITTVPGLQIQGVSATLSDAQISQLRQQALQSALSNATNQATSIIGNAAIVNTTITVGSYYAVPYPVYSVGAANGAGASVPSGKLFYNGTSSVYESITATFYYRK